MDLGSVLLQAWLQSFLVHLVNHLFFFFKGWSVPSEPGPV